MFRAALDWLSLQHPALPWVVMTAVIWLTALVARKIMPTKWEALARWPFGDADLKPAGMLAFKIWQGVPSVLAGAILAAATMRLDYGLLWKGALAGACAPILHELLKALPFVPYRGGPGDGPPGASGGGGVGVLACLVLSLLTGGCGPAPAPCSNADLTRGELAQLQLECAVKRAEACPDAGVEDPCPEVDVECDKRIDRRCEQALLDQSIQRALRTGGLSLDMTRSL